MTATRSHLINTRIVIVGAGHAAGQLIVTLKQKNFDGTIVLLGDETHLPYQRPPLSKKYLAGELPVERLYVKPERFYDDPRIDIRLNTRVESIDTRAATVSTENGEEIAYDTLFLATGSRVRQLPLDGDELEGVHYLRNIDDVNKIRADLERARRFVIVGAGYIGLEVAAVLNRLGLSVTVVEVADRVLSRVVSPQVSAFYQKEHSSRGVDLRFSTGLARFHGDGRVRSVETVDGQEIRADAVLIGIGVVPNSELAEAAGLDTDNGIVVDDHCRCSEPNVFAVGDCTSHPNSIYSRRIRLESVHNALEQAKVAAANAYGDDVSYSQVPWFWSDQYDLKLQIAGLSAGYDDVVIRGNPDDRSFSCLYLQDNRLIAVDAVNAPSDFIQSKALIARCATPEKRDLKNTQLLLKDLA